MQSQSDIDSKKQISAAKQPSVPTTATATEAATQQNRKHHRSPKIIKGKKPLIHFKFYLDICDHQLTKTIEEKINALGGCLEFFLTKNITHFVTDKTFCTNNNNNTSNNNNNNPNNTILKLSSLENPQDPVTPTSPSYSREQSPCDSVRNDGSGPPCQPSIGSGTAAKKQSRADAMLSKARRGTTTATHTGAVHDKTSSNTNISDSKLPASIATQQPYIIWSTDDALRFFKRVSQDLSKYLEKIEKKPEAEKPKSSVRPINLKGSFIKIEATKRSHRPYYQLFRKPSDWPKIELNRDDGAFRLSAKKKQPAEHSPAAGTKMTRKSRSRSTQCQAAPKEESKKPAKKTCIDNIAAKPGDANSTNAAGGDGGGGGACKKVKESSEKQCGVCEICKIEYDALTIHLKTKDHEYFAKNAKNFIALDTLINASANVNNFLDANNPPVAVKSEMEEEIEVAEEAPHVDSNVADPLEGREPSTQKQQKKTVVGTSHKTPSPTLREKSKRSTKGKHSSEKFQNISIAKSSRTLSVSPQKKSSRNSSSMLDAKKSKKEAAKTPASKPGRKKPKAATTSSPIRAMLPPSSLYKVVENTSALPRNCNTPPRKPLDGVAAECDTTTPAIGSPSLIVKFKKVRTTELLRLNGEAENFMFPRCRTSSELPTDLDRQTTSENVVGTSTSASFASTSADSSSDQQMDRVSIDDESNAMDATTEFATTSKATIKRGKGRPRRMQSFPIAPIQPSKFTIKKMPAAPLKACLSLPEATRKSSRTATAIVTAATKSSRLLRAAVEAAKHSKRLSYDCSRSPKGPPKTPKTLLRSLPSATKTPALKRTATVVKLEDGMGEANECDDTDQTDTDDDDEGDAASDDVVDSDEEEDDDADEDYVSSLRDFKVNKKLLNRSKRSCTSDRVQMKAVRELQKSLKREVDSSEEASTANTRAKVKAKGQRKSKTKPNIKSKKSLKAAKVPMKKKAIAHSGFDVSKSELLPQMRFAFERVPTTDPWYRVFVRQDAGEEQVHEYYGSTNYKKLPYELGPIPFNRTLDGISCKLCGQGESVEESSGRVADKSSQSQGQHNQKSEALQTIAKAEETATTTTMPKALPPMLPAQAASSLSLKYTHKKLHLLQRYRREQQELLEKQQDAGQQLLKNRSRQQPETTASAVQQGRSESKASTPDREQYMGRAGSTQSNTSSCASSTGTNLSTKFPRNKHLNKAAYLNLELPPRKSPREHASTLALVSCLIKQRQDSQSKPTSEVDEPPTTPTVNSAEVEEEEEEELLRSKSVQQQPPPAELVDAALPRRPQVGTPIEELRFATEISENVKRLRRGQNKYDHSPTVVPKSMLPKRPSVRRKPLHGNALLAAKLNQRRRQPANLDAQRGRGALAQGKVPSIRKVGCKKGVLEFEMDEAALEALETSKQYTDVRKLEWEIDKYLQLAGKDLDIDDLPGELADNSTKTVPDDPPLSNSNTPPATDYFSSDFDLCDLFSSAQNDGINQAQDQNENTKHSQTKAFSLYNTVALQNYYKKRKNLKSNRTGWPKAQKKKSSSRQREKLADKIQFLQEIGECPAAGDLLKIKEESNQADDDPDAARDRNQQSGMMITPPDTDVDEDAELKTANDNEEYEQEADDIEMDAGGSATEEYEEDTLVDDCLDNPGADGEEDDEEGSATVGSKDRLVGEERNEGAVFYQRATKRKRQFAAASPVDKEASSSVAISCMAASTSTPCKQLLRSLRRSTPQLNGSLGSCVSSSEKAGDNSDIFTVSSDGLDTDLDQSNSRTTVLAKTGSEEHEMHVVNHTPKRKFGLVAYGKGKGVSASAKNASCAIEAASAGSRSLAISQFLTKEVKVTCRRLRTPFRRFRYRR